MRIIKVDPATLLLIGDPTDVSRLAAIATALAAADADADADAAPAPAPAEPAGRPVTPARCGQPTFRGGTCRRPLPPGSSFCHLHKAAAAEPEPPATDLLPEPHPLPAVTATAPPAVALPSPCGHCGASGASRYRDGDGGLRCRICSRDWSPAPSLAA